MFTKSFFVYLMLFIVFFVTVHRTGGPALRLDFKPNLKNAIFKPFDVVECFGSGSSYCASFLASKKGAIVALGSNTMAQ